MPRLTRADIERELLSGRSVAWQEASGKSSSITLDAAKQRRILDFLLKSRMREVKGLSVEFADSLAAAYDAAGDPADNAAASAAGIAGGGPWKIHALRIEGFGGVNAWKGKPLDFELDGESLLIEGPNGSGKSSLTAAIIWALSGERPRDQDATRADEGRPVFGADDKLAGQWPPVATYPTNLSDLKNPPSVAVEIIFADPAGVQASYKRSFDGKDMITVIDPSLSIPSILLEAGLLMPARLPQLRLDQGRGRLTEAVQKLTGLDDLIDLGAFIQGLCHKSRDYLSYKSTELAAARMEFDRQVEKARSALQSVSLAVPSFKPADTDDRDGPMAALGKTLNEKASELTQVVSGDLVAGLDLSNADVQKQVGLALASAEQDLRDGLEGLSSWTTLQLLLDALGEPARTKMAEVTAAAQKTLASAVVFHEQEQADNRYRLKAMGARWHLEHNGTSEEIADCPLCTHSLSTNPELRQELQDLRSAGEAATRRLADNLNAINAALESALPQAVRRYLSDTLTKTPRSALLQELRAKFVTPDRYSKYLAKCGQLVAAALANAPSEELPAPQSALPQTLETSTVLERIVRVEAMCASAEWFEANRSAWQEWWKNFALCKPLPDGSFLQSDPEPVQAHLARLAKALGEAEPYRVGAEALRNAWGEGKTASKIERELEKRTEIAEALTPLKSLGAMAEAQARNAIDELSKRIGEIHGRTYIADSLQFQQASLDKKAGLIVRGKFAESIRIDATLVANTSWLRGVLWAFIFALREEAVEQLGSDPFPIFVLDDPQQTFDSEHRHRWAEQIAQLQKATPGVQLLLATHEELFLSLLSIDGVVGRRTLISSAGPELGHIGLFEGDALDRRWQTVLRLRTPAAAQDYMAAMRVYLEGMLRLMLRGEDVKVPTFVIGDCREKMSVLNNAGHEPWNRSVFKALATILGKTVPEIRYIEMAHHASGAHLGMTEAIDVEKYWKKPLRQTLEAAFRIVREHRALHGGLTALHAFPPSVALPEGYKPFIRGLQFPLIGSAAALTNGKAADGCVHLTIAGTATEAVVLKDHIVLRVTAPTLEPVARPGDLLLVSEHTKPSAKSLVVAMNEDQLLARRLEIAENHSDVAVLTANAINPRMIAPPVVAKMTTLSLKKVIGVIFDHARWSGGAATDMEVCDCGGEAHVRNAFADMEGLVEVSGHSAEPHALDKQFLIIGKSISLTTAQSQLMGHPVIAEDSDGSRYFKRYHGSDPVVILESLEIGGSFAPIVLGAEPGAMPHIQAIWPVLGVLFERPR